MWKKKSILFTLTEVSFHPQKLAFINKKEENVKATMNQPRGTK